MAEQKAAEVKKKGFFSRKKSELAPVPSKTPPAAAKPAAAPRPASAPPAVGPRLSLESMPEVEKRIDRMHATQRRASLMARYENKYGEKLDVPSVFVPVEEEQPESLAPANPETPAAAAPSAAKPAQAPLPAPNVAAAPVTEKPAAPALPPKEVRTPEAKPVAVEAKPATMAAKPAAPAEKPAAAKVKRPNIMTFANFRKYVWHYFRFPWSAVMRYYYPNNGGMKAVGGVLDLFTWIVLAIPRIVMHPLVWLYLKRKKKAAESAAEVSSTAATN
jgi:hypothetical protein